MIARPTKLGRRSIALIGNTPLLRLERMAREFPHVQLLGKAEWYNPGGSVKDRAAFNIVTEGRRSGNFSPGKILLDSTSGNTGIAYAMIAAAEGFPVTLCMPENVSPERKRILFAYGANIVYTPADEGSDGAIRVARDIDDQPGARALQLGQEGAARIGGDRRDRARQGAGFRAEAEAMQRKRGLVFRIG